MATLLRNSREPANLRLGLLSWFRFGDFGGTTGITLDSSGNNNHATLTSNPKPSTFIMQNQFVRQGAWLGTGTEYLTYNSPAFSSVFSVCCWVNADWSANSYTGIVTKNSIFCYIRSTGAMAIYWNNGGASVDPFASGTVPINKWTHTGWTVGAGGAAAAYINGFSVATGSSSGSTGATAAQMLIGNDPSAGRVIHGQMADVRFYNRTLSPGEVLQIYQLPFLNQGYSPLSPLSPPSFIPDTSLMGQIML